MNFFKLLLMGISSVAYASGETQTTEQSAVSKLLILGVLAGLFRMKMTNL
jgi:hypothetical protein